MQNSNTTESGKWNQSSIPISTTPLFNLAYEADASAIQIAITASFKETSMSREDPFLLGWITVLLTSRWKRSRRAGRAWFFLRRSHCHCLVCFFSLDSGDGDDRGSLSLVDSRGNWIAKSAFSFGDSSGGRIARGALGLGDCGRARVAGRTRGARWFVVARNEGMNVTERNLSNCVKDRTATG